VLQETAADGRRFYCMAGLTPFSRPVEGIGRTAAMFLPNEVAHTGKTMRYGWTQPGNAALILAALLAFALAGADAWAKGGSGGHGGGRSASGGKSSSHHARSTHHRNRSGSTVFFGSYWAGPAYWLRQAYAPAEPVYYIEKSEEELQTESAWFYCENDAAYYPYVTKCPAGWVKVAPVAAP
jgi:hypothetical protein